MEENIIGGVSPLKAKKMARGKSYGSGKRGTGDTRYKRDKWKKPASGGTSTIPSKKPPTPTKPYTMKDGVPVMNPPGDVNIDDGDNIINIDNKGGYDTETTTTPDTEDKYEDRTTMTTYQQAWDKMGDVDGGKKKNKFGKVFDNLEHFTKEAREYNERTGHTTKKTEKVLVEKGKKGSTSTKRTYKAGSDVNANIYDNDKISVNNSAVTMLGAVGKYRLGGYKAMKNNKKK